jgi:hypothetical protein
MATRLMLRFRRGVSPGNRTNTVAMATALGTLKDRGADAMRALLPQGPPRSRRSVRPSQ